MECFCRFFLSVGLVLQLFLLTVVDKDLMANEKQLIIPVFKKINLKNYQAISKKRETKSFIEFRPLHQSKKIIRPDKKAHVFNQAKKHPASILQVPLTQQEGIAPSLRYTGRLVTDERGVMSVSEVTLVDSLFPQRGISRWGDYSAMVVDSEDDCTFWFTGLYVGSDDSTPLSIGTWSTRIASFRFPPCDVAGNEPLLNFDGIDFTGSYPSDPVGDVGLEYYIQMVNSPDGSVFAIYSKYDGALIAGPILLSTLWQGDAACHNGRGDPIVIWDQFAQRWAMLELGRNLRSLCVYVSASSDPLAGGWFNYQIDTAEFPDYPKMAMYADKNGQGAYVITANESEPSAYILNRSDVLNGEPTEATRLSFPRLPGYAFQSLTPADTEGPVALEEGEPVYLLRHFDDEIHAPEKALGEYDFLQLWFIDLGFKTGSDVRISGLSQIPVDEYESELCGTVSTGCFGQANTGTTLDPLFEVAMWRVTVRNLGGQVDLLGNFTVDVSGHDQGGIRWFELRKNNGGLWELYQEGTLGSGSQHRWMGSIAMDGYENIALGYSVTAEDSPVEDINEPDNTAASAGNITCGTSQESRIGTDDVDYYLLQGEAGKTVSIDIDAAVDNSALNTMLGVFDSQLKLLQTNNVGLANNEQLLSSDSYLLQTLPEDGRVYIAVTASGDDDFNGLNGSSEGFYRLDVSCTDIIADPYEPNNTFLEAAELSCPLITEGAALNTAYDFDYLSLSELIAGRDITIELDKKNVADDIAFEFRVFDSVGVLLKRTSSSESGNGGGLALSVGVPDDGRLYVLVAAEYFTDIGEYILSCN